MLKTGLFDWLNIITVYKKASFFEKIYFSYKNQSLIKSLINKNILNKLTQSKKSGKIPLIFLTFSRNVLNFLLNINIFTHKNRIRKRI